WKDREELGGSEVPPNGASAIRILVSPAQGRGVIGWMPLARCHRFRPSVAPLETAQASFERGIAFAVRCSELSVRDGPVVLCRCPIKIDYGTEIEGSMYGRAVRWRTALISGG